MVEIQDRSVKSEVLMDDLNFDRGNERKYTKKKHNEFSNIAQREKCGKARLHSLAKFVDLVYNYIACAEIARIFQPNMLAISARNTK